MTSCAYSQKRSCLRRNHRVCLTDESPNWIQRILKHQHFLSWNSPEIRESVWFDHCLGQLGVSWDIGNGAARVSTLVDRWPSLLYSPVECEESSCRHFSFVDLFSYLRDLNLFTRRIWKWSHYEFNLNSCPTRSNRHQGPNFLVLLGRDLTQI